MKHVKTFDVVNESIKDYQTSEMNQLKTALDEILNSNQATCDELKNFVIEYLNKFN